MSENEAELNSPIETQPQAVRTSFQSVIRRLSTILLPSKVSTSLTPLIQSLITMKSAEAKETRKHTQGTPIK